MSNTNKTPTTMFILSVQLLIDECFCYSGMSEFNSPVHPEMNQETFNQVKNQVEQNNITDWFIKDDTNHHNSYLLIWVYGKDESKLIDMLEHMNNQLKIHNVIDPEYIMDRLTNNPESWITDTTNL